MRRRILILVIIFASLPGWSAARVPQPTSSLDDLSQLVRPLLIDSIPPVLYEGQSNWGKQSYVPHALHWNKGRPKIEKAWKNACVAAGPGRIPHEMRRSVVRKHSCALARSCRSLLTAARRRAMRVVVFLIALVVILIGVVGVAVPDTVMAMRREYVATPRGIYTVGPIRVAMGLLWILVAPPSRMPKSMRPLGVLVCA